MPRPRTGFWHALDGAVRRIGTYGAILGVLYVLGGEVFLPEEWRFSHFAGLRLGHTEGTKEEAAAGGKAAAKLIDAEAQASAVRIIGAAEADKAEMLGLVQTRMEAAKTCIAARDQAAQQVGTRCLTANGRATVCEQMIANAKTGWCSEYSDILGERLW